MLCLGNNANTCLGVSAVQNTLECLLLYLTKPGAPKDVIFFLTLKLSGTQHQHALFSQNEVSNHS